MHGDAVGLGLSEESQGKVQEQGEDHAQHNHGRNRHVDAEVVALVDEVARQVAEVDDATEENDEAAQKGEPEAQVDQAPTERACIHAAGESIRRALLFTNRGTHRSVRWGTERTRQNSPSCHP